MIEHGQINITALWRGFCGRIYFDGINKDYVLSCRSHYNHIIEIDNTIDGIISKFKNSVEVMMNN